MPATDASWSTQQLTEFVALVSACPNIDTAASRGVERAAEALDAEVSALICGGEVLASIGLPSGSEPRAQLLDAASGARAALEVPGVGSCATRTVRLEGNDGQLVMARHARAFTRQELSLMRGMARVLGLALRSLSLLGEERGLRAHSERQADENARLLGALTERQALLERLARIQRSIVDRARLDDVLDAVVEGAADLLEAGAVTLRLIDPEDPECALLAASRGIDEDDRMLESRASVIEGVAGRAISERRLVGTDDYDADPRAMKAFRNRGLSAAMAAPVWENGLVKGSLCAATREPQRKFNHSEQEVLLAFAEHASLALTDAKNFESAVHRAFHDMLTGLPNRALFLDRLEQGVRRVERSGSIAAVLFLDLDGFKPINDSLGHAAGDELLVEVAARLEDCLRPADTAARFGGDEFAVLLEDLSRAGDATMVASRIMAALQEPVVLHGRRVTVSASIGVALYREAGDDLLRNADLAMYRAKGKGKNRYEVFDPAMHTVVMERLRLEAELQRAVEHEEFTLQFQPIVRLQTGGVAGVEALIRWQHPERGMIYPGDFIPVAEETRLISPIGRWVLNEACRQAVRWQQRHPGDSPLAISVNLSVTQLQQPGLIYEVAEALERSGLDPTCLILEITETLLMDNVELMADTLDGLKRLGVQLAVDDFGTGYSSLQYLRRFPIDILKIAKAFVDGVDTGEQTLAQVILDLGASLGLRVVAEGIEESDQSATLQEMGCRFGQGYHFARPMSRDAIDELLARGDHLEGWPPREGLEVAPTTSAPGAERLGRTPALVVNNGRSRRPTPIRLVEDWPSAASSSGRAPDF